MYQEPFELRKIPGYKYMICSVCGKEWNVSRFNKKVKYVCPKCGLAIKNKRKGKK